MPSKPYQSDEAFINFLEDGDDEPHLSGGNGAGSLPLDSDAVDPEYAHEERTYSRTKLSESDQAEIDSVVIPLKRTESEIIIPDGKNASGNKKVILVLVAVALCLVVGMGYVVLVANPFAPPLSPSEGVTTISPPDMPSTIVTDPVGASKDPSPAEIVNKTPVAQPVLETTGTASDLSGQESVRDVNVDAPPSTSVGPRTLEFPSGYPVGSLYTRPNDGSATWEKYADATGKVEIAPDTEVWLYVRQANISSLENVAPDAFHTVTMSGFSISNDDVVILHHLQGLQRLDLRNSDLGMTALEELREALSDCEILN